jgi:hypothetical protein
VSLCRVAIDAQLSHAAPSHLSCTICGHRQGWDGLLIDRALTGHHRRMRKIRRAGSAAAAARPRPRRRLAPGASRPTTAVSDQPNLACHWSTPVYTSTREFSTHICLGTSPRRARHTAVPCCADLPAPFPLHRARLPERALESGAQAAVPSDGHGGADANSGRPGRGGGHQGDHGARSG